MQLRKQEWTTKVIIAAAFVAASLLVYWYSSGNFVGGAIFVAACLIMVELGAVEQIRQQMRGPTTKEERMRDKILRGLRD